MDHNVVRENVDLLKNVKSQVFGCIFWQMLAISFTLICLISYLCFAQMYANVHFGKQMIDILFALCREPLQA